MGIVSWIVVGLIAGWLAKMISAGSEPGGLVMTLLIGVVGAVVGGVIANALGYAGATGINFYSIIIATLGAVLFLWVWKMLSRRRTA